MTWRHHPDIWTPSVSDQIPHLQPQIPDHPGLSSLRISLFLMFLFSYFPDIIDSPLLHDWKFSLCLTRNLSLISHTAKLLFQQSVLNKLFLRFFTKYPRKLVFNTNVQNKIGLLYLLLLRPKWELYISEEICLREKSREIIKFNKNQDVMILVRFRAKDKKDNPCCLYKGNKLFGDKIICENIVVLDCNSHNSAAALSSTQCPLGSRRKKKFWNAYH